MKFRHLNQASFQHVMSEGLNFPHAPNLGWEGRLSELALTYWGIGFSWFYCSGGNIAILRCIFSALCNLRKGQRVTASDSTAGSPNFVQTDLCRDADFARFWSWPLVGIWGAGSEVQEGFLWKKFVKSRKLLQGVSVYWYGSETLIAWETLPERT